jgi:hypothetical protein
MLRNFTTANIYGSHMPIRLNTEKAILSQFQRLPGIHSEMPGLEILLGRDEDIDFEDLFDRKHSIFIFISLVFYFLFRLFRTTII